MDLKLCSYWWEHPDRDDVWKAEELGRIGEERFLVNMIVNLLLYDETLVDSMHPLT